jgi:hypothetical protein
VPWFFLDFRVRRISLVCFRDAIGLEIEEVCSMSAPVLGSRLDELAVSVWSREPHY